MRLVGRLLLRPGVERRLHQRLQRGPLVEPSPGRVRLLPDQMDITLRPRFRRTRLDSLGR